MEFLRISILMLRQLSWADLPVLVAGTIVAVLFAVSTSLILHIIADPGSYAFGHVSGLLGAALILCGLYVLKMVAHYAYLALIGDLSISVMARLQRRTIAMLSEGTIAYPQRYVRWTLRQMLLRQMNTFRASIRTLLILIARDIPSLLGLHVVMFMHDWRMALFSSVVLPSSLVTLGLLGQRARKREQLADIDWRVALNSVLTLKRPAAITGSENDGRNLVSALRQHRRSFRIAQRSRYVAISLVDWPVGVLLCGSLIYLSRGEVSIGSAAQANVVADAITFLIGAIMVYQPLKRIARSYMRIGRVLPAIRQMPVLGGSMSPTQERTNTTSSQQDDSEHEDDFV